MKLFSRYSPNYDIAVRFPNTKPIINRLSTLPEKLQKKAARQAARKAMGIVRKAAVQNAKQIDDPATAEMIWKNITVQEASRSSKRVGGIVMRVGVRGGAKQYSNTKENVRKRRVGKSYKTLGDKSNPGGDTWYWRFLEFGTSNTRAQSFLRPALAENTQAVTDSVADSISKAIDKLVVSK